MKLYGVPRTDQILKFAYIFIHAVGWTAPPHSPIKTLRQRKPETGSDGCVFGKPPLIAEASTTICTRPNFRATPLFPNLRFNLPTLTSHSFLFFLFSLSLPSLLMRLNPNFGGKTVFSEKIRMDSGWLRVVRGKRRGFSSSACRAPGCRVL